MRAKLRSSVALGFASIVLGAGAEPAGSAARIASRPEPSWGTPPAERGRAERVTAAVEADGVVYLAGDFTGMVPPDAGRDDEPVPRRHLAALDASTGELTGWDPGADRPVRALALSSDGRRLYLGGAFRNVGGHPARYLAALDVASGTVDRSFSPPELDSAVRALALHGDRLYAGGNFTEVRLPGGSREERPQLAAFDADTGDLLDWVPPDNGGGEYVGQLGEESSSGDGLVDAVAVSADGETVFAAGSFLDLGGQPGLAALSAATGRLTDWQPEIDRPVFGLSVWPGDGRTLFAAAGGAGGRLMAFEPGGDEEPVWEVRTDGDNLGVTASHTTVYLFGHYDFIVSAESDCYQHCPGGPYRRHLAAFDARTGKLEDWDPVSNTSTGPYAGALGDRHLWVVGEFSRINQEPQPGVARFPGVP